MDRPAGAPRHWIELKLAGHLHPNEQEEYWRLLKRQDRGTITPNQQVRFNELSDLLWPRLDEYYAALPERTPENDLLLYAQQIAERMWARDRQEDQARSVDPERSEAGDGK